MLDDLVKSALCCCGCMEVWCGLSVKCYSWLEIWSGLHCAAMDVWRYGLDCTVLLRMFGDMVWTALCCYRCLEIWFALHCTAMDVAQSGYNGFTLQQMLRDLVCTASCCYGCTNNWFGSSVWMLWVYYGLLCAVINVGGSGLECFELVWMFG
jgi:hypothetical protein